MQTAAEALNPTDLVKYSAAEVANLADIDAHAVRNEGFRRQAAAERKIAKLMKQLAVAEKEMTDAAKIINSGLLALAA